MSNLSNYIKAFTDTAEQMSRRKISECPLVGERIYQVEEMIEEYFAQVGKIPKSGVLENLASYIMVDDIRNKDVDKISNTNFPILSPMQVKRRERTQPLIREATMDYLNAKLNTRLDSLAKTQHKQVAY